MALICAVSFTASGQIGSYLGPGVLSGGAGDIGTRSGAQVDLRYYFDVEGVYDTGLQPFSLNSKGDLVQINGLYGVQADFGVYGTHRWRQAALGVDFTGSYYDYVNATGYNSATVNLMLGYTYQQSRRLVYDMRLIGGTSSLGYGNAGFYGTTSATGTPDVVNTPTSLLFDDRIYYLQPSMDVTFIQTARTSYTFGGEGYFIRRDGVGLASMNGYNLHGTIQHRVTRNQTIGATYAHIHYDFPPSFGQSDMNTAQLTFATSIGRRWTFNIGGGVTQAEVQGIQQVSLNPVIAALLGVGFGQQAFYREDFYPAGRIILNGRFKTYTLGISASQSVAPGNGVYLTSNQQTAGASYSYTGIRKWNFGLNAGYSKLSGIGQGIQDYAGFTGGLGVTYSLTRALHIIARADSRYQQIDIIGYNRTGYRATLGLGFSPGNVPLSLW
jgi:hypothetical protein